MFIWNSSIQDASKVQVSFRNWMVFYTSPKLNPLLLMAPQVVSRGLKGRTSGILCRWLHLLFLRSFLETLKTLTHEKTTSKCQLRFLSRLEERRPARQSWLFVLLQVTEFCPMAKLQMTKGEPETKDKRNQCQEKPTLNLSTQQRNSRSICANFKWWTLECFHVTEKLLS